MIIKWMHNLKHTLRRVPAAERIFINTSTIYHGHTKINYKGIRAIRCPFDYVMYQMIIHELKPDLIIEIGTNYGGSAIYFSDLMDAFEIDGEIHSIDINSNALENVKAYSRIKLFMNGWEDYDLNLTEKFKTILVIEDAAHTYECSIGAMEKFASVVTPGSYLIVEDGIVNDLGREEEFKGGPLKAIREFLSKHQEFEVDRKWCDMFGKNATFNVNGYLKKI
jgi:cephalosporin hydroxylase